MTVFVRSVLLFVALGSPALSAKTVESGPTDLERIFGQEAAAHLYSPDVDWRPNLESVVWVDRSDQTNSKLMEFDPVSGDRRMLFDEAHLVTEWGDRPGRAPTLDEPVWQPDGAAILISNTEDPILVVLDSGILTPLNAGIGTEMHPTFSPDGRRIAWVRDNNLWVYDLSSNLEIQLSHDGSETIFNGTLDWVYKEEIADRDGRAFQWSGDGSAIAWLRLDDGEIPVYHLTDVMNTHSRITEQRYPTPGDPSPQPSLHVVRFGEPTGSGAEKKVVFEVPLPYIPRFGFTPDGDLWYQSLDRAQEKLQLVRFDLESSSHTVLLEESDIYWTEPVDGIHFFDDGSFLWLSRREGHTHLYRVQPDGALVDLSPGPWEVTELIGVDPTGRFVRYQAARPNPMERRLFSVDLTNGDWVELTPGAGTHSGKPSASGGLLISTSTIATPPRRWVMDGSGAKGAEIPVEHPLPLINYGDHRFVSVTADDGITLNALLLFPPDFDESKRYPVVIYTYGGPHAQVALNAWPRNSGLFNRALTGRGFVVFALDNRGSAARGREFEGATDLALGSKQLPDQLAGVTWLKAQPWADPARIGIWGWSYGGYMTTYALTHAPGAFAAGAAVAPVTDWRLYDSIYTERYMGSPEENPGGYAAASVLDAVGDLEDPLLVIHGTGDDNVHVQHTLQFADRAWREGVRFDLMLFPNLKHGINTPGSHLQVFSAIADFFERYLMEAEVGEIN